MYLTGLLAQTNAETCRSSVFLLAVMFQLFVVNAWLVCPEVIPVFQKLNKPAVIKDATFFIALYNKHSTLDKVEARLDLFAHIAVSS